MPKLGREGWADAVGDYVDEQLPSSKIALGIATGFVDPFVHLMSNMPNGIFGVPADYADYLLASKAARERSRWVRTPYDIASAVAGTAVPLGRTTQFIPRGMLKGVK